MFTFVENNKVVIQIILGAVALTFVGFGVSSYSTVVDDPYLVKIGATKITMRDLDRELNGQPVDATSRQRALDGMIQRDLLLSDAQATGLTVSATQLQQAISVIPQFQDNGQFSLSKYKDFLAERQLTGPQFEERISRDLLMQSQLSPFTSGQIVSRTLTAQLAATLGETRAVRALLLTPQSFAAQVKTDDAAVSAYYKANAARFKAPEAVRLGYVVLSQEQLAQSLVPTAEETQKYYTQHQAEFGAEQRRASHILLTVPQGASAEVQARVKAEAEALLKQVRANPASFAAVARSRSQDPGSADKGGDLGFFAHGAMVKSFDAAVFSMKPGQISNLVKSEYGYHIIRLDEVKHPDLEASRAQVEQRVKLQKAAALFRSKVETLTEVAYQQGDSLKGVADALNLTPQQSGWVARDKAATDPVLSNPKVLAAAFSNDVLLKKHNSEPIDLGNNSMVVVRVLDHQPAHMLALADVKDAIKAELVSVEGAKLAAARGAALSAALKAGKGSEAQGWSQSHAVSRQNTAGLPPADLQAIFSANTSKLPAFAGVKHATGEYVIYRVDQVQAAAAATPDQRQQLAGVIGQMNANAQAMSYLSALRLKFPIKAGKQSLTQAQDE
jgi:peptidyl-prolyl cis-trans isomerase D